MNGGASNEGHEYCVFDFASLCVFCNYHFFSITCEWKKLYGPKISGRLLCVVDELYVQVWLIPSLCCCCCCLLCSLQPLFLFFNLDYEQVTKWWEMESELTKPKRILFIFRFNISCKQKAGQNLFIKILLSLSETHIKQFLHTSPTKLNKRRKEEKGKWMSLLLLFSEPNKTKLMRK